jgi:TetR/AcrR family transcriptional repressor of nem operon
MARSRDFDLATALDRAMGVFWAKGYKSSSLDDLCAATGISRSSLYAAFGDKRNLLLQSLDHYLDRGWGRIAETLSRTPIREAFAKLLDEFIHGIIAGPGRRGCFIGNCAAELPRHDGEAMERVNSALARNTAIFHDALVAAKARGELSPKADPEALSRFLTASIQGLRLVGKVNPDRAVLEDIAKTIVRCIY